MRSRAPAAAAAAFAALLGAGAMLGAPGAAAAPPPPPPETIRMSLGSIVPEGTPWSEELKLIKARVERESAGRIKVSLFLSGRRGSENDMLIELRRGKLHGAALSTGAVAAEIEELQSLEFPFLFRTPEEVDAVLEGPIGDKLEKLAEERGMVLATWGENGWRSIGTRGRPVRSPDDLRGVRVRAQESKINYEFWKTLDAAPTRIPLNEVMNALKTSVIDGFDQTPVYMSAAGWHTEIQYFSLTEHSYQGGCVIYHKPFLDGLPDDLRKIVLADALEAGRRNRAAVRAVNRDILKELEAAKVQVLRLSDKEREAFAARTRGIYDKFKDIPAGSLVPEIQKTLADIRATKPAR